MNSWLHPRFLPPALPIVSTVHHAIHHPDAIRAKRALQRRYHAHWVAAMERRNLARAAAVVAVSAHAADAAAPVVGSKRVRIIYNGVDLGGFRPPAISTRRPGDPFRLLYVGKWTRAKGADVLPMLMASLGERFSLSFTGPHGGLRGLPSNMHDLGRLSPDQVAEAMRQADAFVFPSRVEGFGLVTIEAMASGLVPLAANNCASPEIIEHGRSGFLCDVNDIETFAAPIRTLAQDAISHAAMAANARSRVEQAFSIDVMVDRYLSTYEEVA
ncbi:MAG: glycosyltransferase family 4 protein [Luteimonas sp.]